MKTPSVSIVIPLLDSPLVGQTLEALAAQQQPGFEAEVVVVGRDGHGQVPRDASVRFLETPEAWNPARARNLGVTSAAGDLLLFTDSDCVPDPGWVQAMATALETAPVAGGAVTFPSSDLWSLADNIASFHELLADRPAEAETEGPLGSLNLAVRREAWDWVGPFDEELVTSEDLDWVLRARAAGLATAFVPGAVVSHAAVRSTHASLRAHAVWYGRHFHAFRERHPGVFDRGPTWRSRRRLALTAPVKAVISALAIFYKHRQLLTEWRALPGVIVFKWAWYRTVVRHWPEG